MPPAAVTCPVLRMTPSALWNQYQYFNWQVGNNWPANTAYQDNYDVPPSDRPCISYPATCNGPSDYTCTRGIRRLTDMNVKRRMYEVKPGSPAVCGHGNREFSFFVRPGDSVQDLIILFAAGGICWDAASCSGVTGLMSIDSMNSQYYKEKFASVPVDMKRTLRDNDPGLKTGIVDAWSIGLDFLPWSLVVIPDCTGDMHIGNRTRAVNHGTSSCYTVHHKGAVNTGLALQWVLDNFKNLKRLLLVGSYQEANSKAYGAHGVIFWAKYLQEQMPSTVVRTVVDSSMGIAGPWFKAYMADDIWGTANALVPTATGAGAKDKLLPPPYEWAIWSDDITSYYRWATSRRPSLAFAEVSSIEDDVQKNFFIMTGGMSQDCCNNGCGCSNQIVRDSRNGQLDWTKTRKVQILRRNKYIPNNYRSWMISTSTTHGLLVSPEYMSICPKLGLEDFMCPQQYILQTWTYSFINAKISYNPEGIPISSTFLGTTYSERNFGYSTCLGCLDGVLGSGEYDELCNVTIYDDDTFRTVAARYNSNWVSLWALNGGYSDCRGVRLAETSIREAPDQQLSGRPLRFAHEYRMEPGENLEDVAKRFGVTVQELVYHNYNLMTHIDNPLTLPSGDVVCIVSRVADAVDAGGSPICMPR
ncbi:hypothetical protein GUITHDRAFT_139190 [Guillardia theta CCMP2712]|uniref:LysM domain-containing protein n=1 Tax=Guillardia theta (strain CCMP2712) TaxID=905079 RepID=L1J9S7_GUITC|nr:hypothetical protein GUITHDRAFT_139190 [Guillardia theta CCMP2712]EKX45283.1 hypothetical protein GUITHDRAFT_139190 [Guillardia theta CCMP2712]|eukprot:XP_005832263.1 hypothetical protein GUITHDRAFT_139190 [Guillardia theta CCMP2712]